MVHPEIAIIVAIKTITMFSHKPYLLAYISTDGAVGIVPYRKANVAKFVSSTWRGTNVLLVPWRTVLLLVMLLIVATLPVNRNAMNLMTIGRNILQKIVDKVIAPI